QGPCAQEAQVAASQLECSTQHGPWQVTTRPISCATWEQHVGDPASSGQRQVTNAVQAPFGLGGGGRKLASGLALLAQMLEVDSAADGVSMMPVDKLWWSHDRIYDHFGDGKSVHETVVELIRIWEKALVRHVVKELFQLVLRRLKSEDSEVLVPVMLKRPTGDFFRRVGIALSTDTLGRSVSVSGQAPEAQESLVAAVSRAVVRSARRIDQYEDQPWTVCQPAHPGLDVRSCSLIPSSPSPDRSGSSSGSTSDSADSFVPSRTRSPFGLQAPAGSRARWGDLESPPLSDR
ncbi:unnamed protein product, partial [Polarella glacialis]